MIQVLGVYSIIKDERWRDGPAGDPKSSGSQHERHWPGTRRSVHVFSVLYALVMHMRIGAALAVRNWQHDLTVKVLLSLPSVHCRFLFWSDLTKSSSYHKLEQKKNKNLKDLRKIHSHFKKKRETQLRVSEILSSRQVVQLVMFSFFVTWLDNRT